MSEAEDGVIPHFMARMLGRSWKTTLAGVAAVVCGLVPLLPGMHPLVYEVSKVLAPLFAGGGLLMAKDRNVSGGKL